MEKLGHVVPLRPGLWRCQLIAELVFELGFVFRPREGSFIVEHDVDIAIERHGVEGTAPVHIGFSIRLGDIVQVQLQPQFFDIGFERLKMPRVIGKISGVEHNEVPRTATAGEL